MKLNHLLYVLPAFVLTSCSPPDPDDANDAAGTASPYLAREVVAVWQLSTDQNAGYDEPCNLLEEGFIGGMFDLKATDEVEALDYPNGCRFKWEGGEASIAFGGPRPYPSIYHAEYIFDKNYQPGQTGNVSGQVSATSQKPALSGPNSQGTGAERPAMDPDGGKSADMDDDSSAVDNDSSSSVSGITPAATQFAKPAIGSSRFAVVEGLGDKAVWEPAKNTMHVLYNNHIVNVRVQTKANELMRQQKAASLANIMLDRFSEGH